MFEEQESSGLECAAAGELVQYHSPFLAFRNVEINNIPTAFSPARTYQEGKDLHLNNLSMAILYSQLCQVATQETARPAGSLDKGSEHCPTGDRLNADRSTAGPEVEDTARLYTPGNDLKGNFAKLSLCVNGVWRNRVYERSAT